jgi:hypothetical protein
MLSQDDKNFLSMHLAIPNNLSKQDYQEYVMDRFGMELQHFIEILKIVIKHK